MRWSAITRQTCATGMCTEPMLTPAVIVTRQITIQTASTTGSGASPQRAVGRLEAPMPPPDGVPASTCSTNASLREARGEFRCLEGDAARTVLAPRTESVDPGQSAGLVLSLGEALPLRDSAGISPDFADSASLRPEPEHGHYCGQTGEVNRRSRRPARLRPSPHARLAVSYQGCRGGSLRCPHVWLLQLIRQARREQA